MNKLQTEMEIEMLMEMEMEMEGPMEMEMEMEIYKHTSMFFRASSEQNKCNNYIMTPTHYITINTQLSMDQLIAIYLDTIL